MNTAISKAQNGIDSVVIGDDTDLLVLLVALAPCQHNLNMMMPGKGKTPSQFHNVIGIQSQIGDMKNVLLPFHALTGCDTVSFMLGKGEKNTREESGSK